MTPYGSLSKASMDICAGVCLLVMLISIMLLTMVIVLGLRKRNILIAAVFTAVLLALAQGLGDVSLHAGHNQTYRGFSAFFAALPWAAVIAFLVSAALMELIFLGFLKKQYKGILTPNSVKESLDALPDGICFFDGSGQPLLVNTRMNQLSSDLFGKEILNCELFWEKLSCSRFSGSDQVPGASPAVMIRTSEGSIWDFRRKDIEIDGRRFYEMTAFDVTQQYKLHEELNRRNEILDEVNRRLKEYSRQIEKVAAEKELLAAKMRVHDNVGKVLLAFRSGYLNLSLDKRDRNRLLELWRMTVSDMRKAAVSGKERDDWQLLQQAAEAVDVEMILEGELPENSVRPILIAAVHECLTNMVRHAGGHRLHIAVRTENGLIKAEFTNDGIPPTGEIKETGGLGNLRRIVENAGGTMRVQSAPRFALHIEIAKGAKANV